MDITIINRRRDFLISLLQSEEVTELPSGDAESFKAYHTTVEDLAGRSLSLLLACVKANALRAGVYDKLDVATFIKGFDELLDDFCAPIERHTRRLADEEVARAKRPVLEAAE